MTALTKAERHARFRAKRKARIAALEQDATRLRALEKEAIRLRAELEVMHAAYDRLCTSLVGVSPKPQGQGAAQ
jgi:cell shape-determining protein MreC